jgi:hypothetical protein
VTATAATRKSSSADAFYAPPRERLSSAGDWTQATQALAEKLPPHLDNLEVPWYQTVHAVLQLSPTSDSDVKPDAEALFVQRRPGSIASPSAVFLSGDVFDKGHSKRGEDPRRGDRPHGVVALTRSPVAPSLAPTGSYGLGHNDLSRRVLEFGGLRTDSAAEMHSSPGEASMPPPTPKQGYTLLSSTSSPHDGMPTGACARSSATEPSSLGSDHTSHLLSQLYLESQTPSPKGISPWRSSSWRVADTSDRSCPQTPHSRPTSARRRDQGQGGWSTAMARWTATAISSGLESPSGFPIHAQH